MATKRREMKEIISKLQKVRTLKEREMSLLGAIRLGHSADQRRHADLNGWMPSMVLGALQEPI